MYAIDLPDLFSGQLTLSQMTEIMRLVAAEMYQRIYHQQPTENVKLPSIAASVRSKRNAKENESADVEHLIGLLNDSESEMGMRLREGFQSVFEQPLLRARRGNAAGGRGHHYDFEIETPNGWLKVEHKGSIKNKPIAADSKPWEQGVQFHNGGANKYSISKKYAEAWYTKYIGSGLLKERYGLTSPIPSLEEWIQRDARVQGDPNTAFGQELKRVYRAAHPGESLDQERDEFVKEFYDQCTSEDKQIFAAEVLPIIQNAFAEKDVWLQIAGNVHSDSFHFRWSGSIAVNQIESVEIHKKSDIQFTLRCDNGFILHPTLRWGKGQGFSNIRLDLK